MVLFTCNNCPNRYPGCHDKCEKYQQEKAEHERLKALNDADRYIDQYTAAVVTKHQNDSAIRRKRTNGYGKHYAT